MIYYGIHPIPATPILALHVSFLSFFFFSPDSILSHSTALLKSQCKSLRLIITFYSFIKTI